MTQNVAQRSAMADAAPQLPSLRRSVAKPERPKGAKRPWLVIRSIARNSLFIINIKYIIFCVNSE